MTKHIPHHCSRCNKIINKNVSNLCRACYKYIKNKEFRERRKKEKRCIICGKNVNAKIVYPDGENGIKLVSYPMRCYKCSEINKKRCIFYKKQKNETKKL